MNAIEYKKLGFYDIRNKSGVWYTDIITGLLLRNGDIILRDGRAMLVREHPHWGFEFSDVTPAFMAGTGDAKDIDETYEALREATR